MGWRERAARWLFPALEPPVPTLALQIAKIELRPGDRLVVKTDRRLSTGEMLHLKTQLREALPEGVGLMMVGYEMSMAVLSPAQAEPESAA